MAFKRKDHYEVLKVHRHADKKTIKKQYYRLSKQYHPDLNPNNAEAHKKFLEVNEAYAVLGNEASRRQYDYDMDDQPPSSSVGNAPFRTGPSASWHGRARRARATGSASAQAQAEAMRKQWQAFNQHNTYAKRYEAEEERRRARMSQAAERRRAAGFDEPDPTFKHDPSRFETFWSRLWKLGLVLAGIAYATDRLYQVKTSEDRSST